MSETDEVRMVRQELLRAVREMKDVFLEMLQEEACGKW